MNARDLVHKLFRRGRGGPDGLFEGVPPEDRRALAGLLADADAPARPAELAGEADARAAFRAARDRWEGVPAPVPTPRRRRPALVLAAAAAVLLVGGTAYAAGTGRLPGAVERTAQDILGGGGRTPAASGSPGTRAGTRPPATPPTSAGPTPPADPTVLVGLCRSWAATAANPNAKALTPEELRTLEAAAGGSAGIGPFCAGLTGRPDVTPAPAPTTGKPGNAPPNTRRPSNAGRPTDN